MVRGIGQHGSLISESRNTRSGSININDREIPEFPLHAPLPVSNVDQRRFADGHRIRQKLFMNDCQKLRFYIRPHRACVNEIFCFIHMLGNAVLGLYPKLAQIIGQQIEKLLPDCFTNGIPIFSYFVERQRRNIQFDLTVRTAF